MIICLQGDVAYNQGPRPTKLPDCMGYRAWSALRTCRLEFSRIARGQAKNPKDEHDTFARLSQSELHVVLHQNLPQSKDVESIFVTICLHDRRQHRRRQLFG